MICFEYSAAGRLVKEGNKTYRYGYLDKVMSVTKGDKTYTYTYHADGQLASANYGGKTEDFLWDGLALIQRGDEQFINEPHVGGGNPVASSKGTSYFNDALGTTLGSKSNGKYSAAALTAFGERLDNADGTSPAIRSLGEGWFTGKPYVEGLGHAFLMRNYRAGLAKWQSADPMGYPDGWNALAYCNNGVTGAVDMWGCEIVILGEVKWNGLHLATVWADCNHNYNNPSFVIKQGKLAYDPLQEIDGTPDYYYASLPVFIGDKSYLVEVSFEKNPDFIFDKTTDPYNCRVKWEYQIKLTVTCSWMESQTITDPEDPEKKISVDVPMTSTLVERQTVRKGEHNIPKHAISE